MESSHVLWGFRKFYKKFNFQWLSRGWSAMVADNQLPVALNQLEMPEHIHPEQYFVAAHARDDAGADLVQLDIT